MRDWLVFCAAEAEREFRVPPPGNLLLLLDKSILPIKEYKTTDINKGIK